MYKQCTINTMKILSQTRAETLILKEFIDRLKRILTMKFRYRNDEGMNLRLPKIINEEQIIFI